MKNIITIITVTFILSGWCNSKSEEEPQRRAQMIEAFKAAFEKAYTAGDKERIWKLIDLEGSHDNFKGTLKGIITLNAGAHTIKRIEFSDYDPDPNIKMEINGKKIKTTTKCVYWFICETVAKEGSTTGQIKTPVGLDKEGKLVFTGLTYE
jgi:hypothetical protein